MVKSSLVARLDLNLVLFHPVSQSHELLKLLNSHLLFGSGYKLEALANSMASLKSTYHQLWTFMFLHTLEGISLTQHKSGVVVFGKILIKMSS